MSKFASVFSFALFCFPHVAAAQIIISEIMYDLEGSDTGREWIEVLNSGSSSVTLAEWKLFEADSNHGITPYSGGESLVSGAYAVIADNPAKFLEDHPNYTGVLFDSVFSLSNTGETLTLRCCATGESLTDRDSVFYDPAIGAAGDGNSLHRISGGNTLSAALSTPGAGTLTGAGGNTSAADTGEESSNSGTSNISTASVSQSKSTTLAKVSAGNNRTITVGIDTALEGNAYDSSNRSVEAEFRWNFGDGTTALGQKVMHRWEYPGRYAVVLQATRFGETLSARFTITVEFPKLSFGPLPDGGIVVENLSTRELDLSGWRISERGMAFIFPPNTIVLRDSSIRISSASLGFYATGEATLLFPNGSPVKEPEANIAEPTPDAPEESDEASSAFISSLSSMPPEFSGAEMADASLDAEQTEEEEIQPAEELIPENTRKELAASAAAVQGEGLSLLWWLGAVLLVCLGGYAVYAARHLGRREWTIIEDTSE